MFFTSPAMIVRIAPPAPPPTNLADDGPDIEVATRRACQRRNDGLQKLSAADAAEGPGDGVAETPEVVVLECRAGSIAADNSRDDLNDQINEH
jgi:hypothetical protein